VRHCDNMGVVGTIVAHLAPRMVHLARSTVPRGVSGGRNEPNNGVMTSKLDCRLKMIRIGCKVGMVNDNQ
jgi:hypothetical protein